MLGRFYQRASISHTEFMQEVCSASLAGAQGVPEGVETFSARSGVEEGGGEDAAVLFEQFEEAARVENQRARERLGAWQAGAPLELAAAPEDLALDGGLMRSGPREGVEALPMRSGLYRDPLMEARRALEDWGQQSRLSSGRFLPVYASPSDWMNETVEGVEPGFVEFTAGSRRLDDSPFSGMLSGSSGGLTPLEARVGALPLQTRPDDMRVSMKLLRVELFRPWFRAGLLSRSDLRMQGRAAGCFSRGSADPIDPHKLIFPLWTTAALVMKDCVVEAPWSTQDRTRLSEGSGPVRLGPFSSGAKLEGDRLRFSGMSLVGYLCRMLPFFPPAA